jgi:tripartite-type tricarboxylate transporter receptor subunit TctC
MKIKPKEEKMTKKQFYLRVGILVAFAVAFSAMTAGVAVAEYPDKPITFIVPYSPGGGSDQQARRLQPGLEKALGVNIKIVYKTGGGGAVGFSELWRSKPDGYTISNVVVPNIVVSAKGKDVGFKPGEFAYIGMSVRAAGAFMVPKGSKYKSIDQFVADAKANPGKLTTAGVGATGAANFAELSRVLGIKVTYVPVSGGVGKLIPMLQGNHVDSGMVSSAHAVRHKATVDALLIAGPSTSAALPGVPNEPKWTMSTTWGIMAPPGTPADRIAKLNEALNKATAEPRVVEMTAKNGLLQIRHTPADAKAVVEDAIKKFSK